VGQAFIASVVHQWARRYAALETALTPTTLAFGRRMPDRFVVMDAETPSVLQERLARRFLMQYGIYQMRIRDGIGSVGPLSGPLHRIGSVSSVPAPSAMPRRLVGFGRNMLGADWERWPIWMGALRRWQPDAMWWSPVRLWRDGTQWWALDSWVGFEQSDPPSEIQDFWADLMSLGVLVLVVIIHWPTDWALDPWDAFERLIRYPSSHDQLQISIWPGGRDAQGVQMVPGWHPTVLVERLDTGLRLGLWERLITRAGS